MRHRYLTAITLLALINLSGCGFVGIDEYDSVGFFPNRITAENAALTYLVNGYDDLFKPNGRKIIYSYCRNENDVRHAIWYDKRNKQLALECDVNSGTCCTWKGITKEKLSQIIKMKKGVFDADLVAKPYFFGYREEF